MDKELPVAPSGIGNYITYKKVGDYIYTSGHIPFTDKKKYQGKIPSEVSVEDGYEAASLCAELTISTLLANVEIENLQPVNVLGFVNADNNFQDHAKVLNGFTDKLAEYFEKKSTRSAVGVSSLPLNVSVEVQCIFVYE